MTQYETSQFIERLTKIERKISPNITVSTTQAQRFAKQNIIQNLLLVLKTKNSAMYCNRLLHAP